MSSKTITTSPPPAPAGAHAARNRWPTYAAIGVILAGAAVWLIAASRGESQPRLNDNAVVLTQFIDSKAFEQIPFEQQRQYYKVMDDRDQELDQAFAAKKLTESEYRAGLEAAWLGKHLNRVEKYFALAPGSPRMNYVAKLLEKKEKKKTKVKPNAADEQINVDETAAELKVEKWPAAVRTQWTAFHDAYHAQRKALEKSREPQVPQATTKLGGERGSGTSGS
jgi:hypothetical protein